MPIGTSPLNDGNHIPNLAFGTGSALEGKDAQDAVKAALKAGFRHVDTAQAYSNEESVGAGLGEWLRDEVGVNMPASQSASMTPRISTGEGVADARKDVWVTTKFYQNENQPKKPFEALKDSLQKLDLDYVDLYLIHGPQWVNGDMKGTWREMEQAKRDGLAKSIGVSNFDATDLYELWKVAEIKPAVNQIHLHPYIYHSNIATLKYCHDHGIRVEAYGSLYPITQLPDGPVTAALKAPSRRLGASLGQVLFLWARAKDAVVVTTTNGEERLREYLEIGELGSLTKEEVNGIDNAAIPIPVDRYLTPSDESEKVADVPPSQDLELGQGVATMTQKCDRIRLLLRLTLYITLALSTTIIQKYAGRNWVASTAALSLFVDIFVLILLIKELRKALSRRLLH